MSFTKEELAEQVVAAKRESARQFPNRDDGSFIIAFQTGCYWQHPRSDAAARGSEIYTQIVAERERQDDRWGGPKHDDEHSINDFIAYITKHAGKAVDMKRGYQRQQMFQVAALAVAVIEKLDREAAPKQIIVNGISAEVKGSEITFAEVVRLAFDKPPANPEGLTVTYSGPNRMGSMLVAMAPLPLENGMIFSVADTSNA
jgi:hypothetical protein